MNFQLSKSQIRELIKELLKRINDDKFVIIKRDKNILFIRQYLLNKTKIKNNILSKISSNNFVSIETDNDSLKYGIEPVIIFHVNCNLINFHGEVENVNVYVKIKNCDDMIVTISLHKCER